jgi:hypothetical protein
LKVVKNRYNDEKIQKVAQPKMACGVGGGGGMFAVHVKNPLISQSIML